MHKFKNILIFVLLAAFIIFVGQYPVYYALQNTPSGFFHTGQASWFDPWDINVYVSTIKYGQQHGILLKNLYSTELDSGVLYYPIYTIAGSLFSHVDAFILYDLMVVLSSLILLLAIYYFGRKILHLYKIDNSYHVFFLILFTAIGRGMSWLTPAEMKPADLYVTSFTFRSVFQRPHEAFGVIFYICAMLSFYLHIHTKNKKYFYASIISNCLLILFYPYNIVIFFLVNLIYIIYSKQVHRKRKLFKLLINTGITGFFTLLYFIHLYFSTFNSAVSENQPSVSAPMLIVGYGIFFVTFLLSIFSLKKNQSHKIYMIVWVLTGIVLSYLPIGFARFYLRGLFLPLTFLSIYLYIEIVATLRYRYLKYVLIAGFAVCALASTMYVFESRIKETEKSNPWYYLPIEYKYSFDFLNTAPKDGVLSSYIPGNMIPAYTGKKVFLGHTIQTPNFKKRNTMVNNFYAGSLPAEQALSLLRTKNIHYIYFSHFESNFGNGFLQYPFLKPVFISDKVIVYEVKDK